MKLIIMDRRKGTKMRKKVMSKNVVKKMLVILLAFVLVANIFDSELLFAKVLFLTEDDVEDVIPDEAVEFVESNLADLLELAKQYREEFEIETALDEDLTVGKPFVVYNIEADFQDEIYYFPIMEGDDIIFVANVIGTDEGYNFSFSNDLVDELETLDYTEQEDVLFVQSEENIVAETADEDILVIEGEQDEVIDQFFEDDFDDQMKEVVDAVADTFEPVSFEEEPADSTIEVADTYSASFAYNKDGAKVMDLHNAQGQGSYGMCWACAVATTVNYIRGTDYTGKNVCDMMFRGYNTGAYLTDDQKALRKMNISYTALRNIGEPLINFSTIKKNIDSKRPVIISSATADGSKGHAITLIGYISNSNTKWIVSWNSALSGGAGANQGMSYSSSGTSYVISNYTFIYRGSLSAY